MLDQEHSLENLDGNNFIVSSSLPEENHEIDGTTELPNVDHCLVQDENSTRFFSNLCILNPVVSVVFLHEFAIGSCIFCEF